jgi:hypothetical protein
MKNSKDFFIKDTDSLLNFQQGKFPLEKEFRIYAENQGRLPERFNLCAYPGKTLRLAGGSGKDSRMNMSGWSVCFFPENPFTLAGYRQVSFGECRNYQF